MGRGGAFGKSEDVLARLVGGTKSSLGGVISTW